LSDTTLNRICLQSTALGLQKDAFGIVFSYRCLAILTERPFRQCNR